MVTASRQHSQSSDYCAHPGRMRIRRWFHSAKLVPPFGLVRTDEVGGRSQGIRKIQMGRQEPNGKRRGPTVLVQAVFSEDDHEPFCRPRRENVVCCRAGATKSKYRVNLVEHSYDRLRL